MFLNRIRYTLTLQDVTVAPSLLLSVYLLVISAFSLSVAHAQPEWIWINKQPVDDQTVYFRTTFDLDEKPSSATLHATCDDHMIAYVNGQKVFTNSSWQEPKSTDVTSHLRSGTNVIAVEGKNGGGAAGLVAELTVDKGNKKTTLLATDQSWNVTGNVPGPDWTSPGFDDGDWSNAYSFGELGTDPWGNIRFTPPPMPAMSSPEGYEIQRVYRVPSNQGSWVNMTFTPGGHIIASAQNGPLYRISPSSNSGGVQVKPIKIRPTKPGSSKKGNIIGGAQGLAWVNDSLYAVLNNGNFGFGLGLYRLTDQNDDGTLDQAQLLKKFGSHGGEHGPHGVRAGPDGKSLYVIAGNHTHPLDVDHSRQPPVWKEDLLLPRIPPPSGHASNIKAPGGSFYRTDLKGEQWELIASGMRNAYDFDFNRHGEPFTFDADMEYDLGLPWYRPTRVTHITSGAEFGWRNGSGKWPKYYPDSIPPTVEIGQSSPTGVTFGYETNFPKEDRRTLYVGDWSLGRIFAVHLTPDGASYTGTAEDFITGKPLPVSDMAVGPDGALYFMTGGRGTKSALYRVTYTGSGSNSSGSGTISRKKKKKARKARTLRKRLEQLHAMEGKMSTKQLKFAWSHLSSHDRFIRYAARIAVEHASVDRWRSQAFQATDPWTTIMSHLALARHGNKNDRAPMIKQLTKLNWKNLELQQKRALLRVYALSFIRLGSPSDTARKAVINHLNPHFPASEYTVNKELSRVLGYLEAPEVIDKTLHLLTNATAHNQEIHYGYVLRTVENGWTVDQLETFLKWTNRARTYGGGRVLSGNIKEIRKQTINNMNKSQKKQLASVINAKPEKNRPDIRTDVVKNWTMEDLLPAVQQSLEGRNFERGRRMYRVAQCSQCHQMNGAGGITGPNLTTVGQRFSREYILESIIKPSEEISNRFRRSAIKKSDGSTVYGRIVNIHGSTLHVMKNPMDPSNLTNINRKNVKSIEPADTSSMPPGLINTLNKQEVLDLMGYLISGGDPDHKIFQDN
jgi:putative heme-binding domain-containing protein